MVGQSDTRSISLGRVVAVVAVVLAVYFVWQLAQVGVGVYRLQTLERRLRSDNAALEAEIQALDQRIEVERTDAAVEKYARDELGLTKPGEIPIVAIPPKGKANADVTAVPGKP